MFRRMFSASNPNRAPVFYANILRKFENRRLHEAAATFQDEFSQTVRRFKPVESGLSSEIPLQLPDACPHCGAPLREDEVEWVDADCAQCIYCGGVVHTGEA